MNNQDFIKLTHAQKNTTLFVNMALVRCIEQWNDDLYILHFDGGHTLKCQPGELEKYLQQDTQGEILEIVTVKAGTTSNSNSQMWRCYTSEGEQINFFKHEEAHKNTFPLLDKADYGEIFENMKPDECMTWHEHPIRVEYRLNGQWREPTHVYSRGQDQPDKTETLDRIKAQGDLLGDNGTGGEDSNE